MTEGKWAHSLVIQNRLMEQQERRSWRQSEGLSMEGSKTWSVVIDEAMIAQIQKRE